MVVVDPLAVTVRTDSLAERETVVETEVVVEVLVEVTVVELEAELRGIEP